METHSHKSSMKMRVRIICENNSPNHYTVHTDFVNNTIACIPLYGGYFSADILSALNCIVSFTTGNPSGTGLSIH